jgi:hypothetical protein
MGAQHWTFVTLLLLIGMNLPAQNGQLRLVERIPLSFIASDARTVRTGSDDRESLLLVSRQGDVFRATFGQSGEKLHPIGEALLRLEDPEFSVLALGRWAALAGGDHLVVANRSGLFAFDVGVDKKTSSSSVELTERTRRGGPRFSYRLGAPRFADLCPDLNGDGQSEFLLPLRDSMEIWAPKAGEAQTLRLERVAALSMNAERLEQTRDRRLSDDLESVIVLPRLLLRDVNGDGRPDILVREGRERSWHLQRADGSIPEKPDVTVNLRIFEDSTPPARLAPGMILAGNQRQILLARDLDGNARIDHVVAHGRKIWVLPGGEQGPQFTAPSQILKSSDDITTLLLADLDQDGQADLITLKLLIPTVGSLLASALGSLTIEISAVAYAGESGVRFRPEPKWRNSLFIELPSLTQILKNPQAILKRFQEAGQSSSERIRMDLDGDGGLDLLTLEGNADRLLLYSGIESRDPARTGDQLLYEVLFSEPNAKWDLDRLVGLVERLADEDLRRDTKGKEPTSSMECEAAADFVVQAIVTAKHPNRSGHSLFLLRLHPQTNRSELLHYRAAPPP